MGLLEDKVAQLSANDSPVTAEIQNSDAVCLTGDGDVMAVDVSKLDTSVIAQVKSIIHSELAVPEPFVHNGISITVLELVYEDNMLKVVLEADCPVDNPYYFINPPIQVLQDDALEGGGEQIVDDPASALQQIVGRAVYTTALQNGWLP
jgi:hypothetical protein